jgi:hypothetical protein
VFLVLWKCQRSGRPAATSAATSASARTPAGTPTPIVSASATSSGWAWTHRASTSATRSGTTSPSNGQPNAAAMVTVVRSPAVRARSAIRVHAAIASSVLTPWLRWLNVSVATTTTLTSSTPARIARSRPRSFSTRPIQETWPRGSMPQSSSASASCGTRAGFTKLVTSIRRTPLPASMPMSSALAAVGRVTASFCSPSRGATSTICTDCMHAWFHTHRRSVYTGNMQPLYEEALSSPSAPEQYYMQSA